MTELPKVATNFYHECKKCEAERYHKVLAHTTSSSAKIECEACGSKKTFKLPTASSATKKTAVKKKRKTRVKGNKDYIETKEIVGEATPAAYKMSDSYEINTAIEHPKFGTGYVFAKTPMKIDVAFEDVNRSFVHNRK